MSSLAEAVRIWVREIILVLFLAGALEMLLPDTDVKRFARVAVGFFVVLAVGRPILGAIGGGFIFDRGLAGLASWELGLAPAGATQPAGAGEGAVQEGTELWQASRDRAVAASRVALETQIATLAERDEAVADAQAEVDLDTDPSSMGYGSLVSLRLIVWMAGAGDGQGTTGQGQGTGSGQGATGQGQSTGSAPGAEQTAQGLVSPVVIQVEPVVTGTVPEQQAGGAQGSAAEAGSPAVVDSGGEEPAPGTPAGELARRLRNELVLLFGVPPGGLVVEVWP